MNDTLKLNLITVERSLPEIECDYVTLSISDSINDRFSGSYGIKKGHTSTVFSIKEGFVTVYKADNIIFKAKTSGGFAFIENNVLDLTVDRIISIETDET